MRVEWILGLVGILLLLAVATFRVREHLEPTEKIKAPDGGIGGTDSEDGEYKVYSNAEQDRIFNLVRPEKKQSFMSNKLNHLKLSETDMLEFIKQVYSAEVAAFYRKVYAKASQPIRYETIENWYKSHNGYTQEDIQKDETGTIALLKTYFVDQEGPPPPTSSAQPTPGTSSPAPTQSTPATTNKTVDVTPPVTITINVRSPEAKTNP